MESKIIAVVSDGRSYGGGRSLSALENIAIIGTCAPVHPYLELIPQATAEATLEFWKQTGCMVELKKDWDLGQAELIPDDLLVNEAFIIKEINTTGNNKDWVYIELPEGAVSYAIELLRAEKIDKLLAEHLVDQDVENLGYYSCTFLNKALGIPLTTLQALSSSDEHCAIGELIITVDNWAEKMVMRHIKECGVEQTVTDMFSYGEPTTKMTIQGINYWVVYKD